MWGFCSCFINFPDLFGPTHAACHEPGVCLLHGVCIEYGLVLSPLAPEAFSVLIEVWVNGDQGPAGPFLCAIALSYGPNNGVTGRVMSENISCHMHYKPIA